MDTIVRNPPDRKPLIRDHWSDARYRRASVEPPMDVAADEAAVACTTSRYAVFTECPLCGGDMRPEHAHFRCAGCGWRDSCCD
jgi:hypothetical protein